MKRITIALLLGLLLVGPVSMAKNIDLVTLPDRDSVQLTIYNSEDLTLVKETRHITVKKGDNKLQFSWAGTLIDPTSVELRLLEQADKIEVADTVFPGQKPQHLYWNLESEYEGEVKMEVTYFTSGISWSMDYVAICNPDETAMQFNGYVRVFNNSGEEYDNAEIRLIVGTINLVEKIATLAQQQGIPVPAGQTREYDELRRKSAAKAYYYADEVMMDMADMPSEDREEAATIVKEGLSEYFMFSVEGSETIPNGWSKRMQAVDAADVEFDIVYRMRSHQYGAQPVQFFIWNNDAEHSLGDSPLPDGQVNLFKDNGDDGLSFLARQYVRYVPIKADLEINLGTDDLVVYETKRSSVERMQFTFNVHNNVHGWDEKTLWTDTIRNYHTKPITFELRRQWPGDIELESEIETTLFDYRTAEMTVEIGSRDKEEYPVTIIQHFGANAKQNAIKLK
jgi:hypothetical protein